MTEISDETPPPTPRLGWKSPLIVLAVYVVSVFAATYPLVLTFRSTLPGSRLDPLQHLWIMRWYKACLLEGRLPTICPELQYPVGAPLGNFSPLHFQALLFIPLSLLIGDDVICFNLIWLFGMLFTGMGTFLLAWHVVRDTRCAALGGLLAMLSGPMMLHAGSHLELIHLGCFPIFLLGWMRFVDAPSHRRLAAAAALYILCALCAAYYAMFVIIPAMLYVLRGAFNCRRSGLSRWLRERMPWFGSFAAVALLGLLIVFSNHLWAIARGYSTARPLSEFARYSVPLWSYATPTVLNALGRRLPINPYALAEMGWSVGERASYLGVVTLGLLAYAGIRSVRFAKAGYWWTALAVMMVLSFGAYAQIGRFRIGLPALWLKKYGLIFAMIRVPARFNLFVGVVAGVVAAAGLKHLLNGVRRPVWQWAIVTTLGVVAVLDLANVPFGTPTLPRLPACYAAIKARNPQARILEIPQFNSGGSELNAQLGYWQSLHRLRTNAGYSGQSNFPFDNLVTWNSPFGAHRLADEHYLDQDGGLVIDVVHNVSFADYAWLYLTANQFDYVVLHHAAGAVPEFRVHLDSLKAKLSPAKVFEDDEAIVYDRELLSRPAAPVFLTADGWRLCWEGGPMRAAQRTSRLAAYNPDPERPLRFAIETKAFHRRRTVRLMSGRRELVRWAIRPGSLQYLVSEPFFLPAGLQELTLVCDGESRPTRPEDQPLEWDNRPYSLKVSALGVVQENGTSQMARQPDSGIRR